jgi:hypothetical protein
MSYCSGIKCRNTGSGYEKQATGQTAEMDARMKDLLAKRAADDARIWKQPETTPGLHTLNSSSNAPINSAKGNGR